MSKVKIRGDRNVPWIGDLAFRDVIPLKYVSKINTATLPENTSPETILDYIDISAVDSDGHIGDIQELTFETAPSRARRVVRKGDTIVSTVRTYLKAIAHIDWDNPRLVCSTGFAVVSPSEGMDPKYMYYWLRSTPIVDEISARSVGVSYPAIGPSEVGSLPVPRIPERLQRDIVAFLDGRIRAIDKILGRYQLLIERLHEYRQALITQAVTKGLDPNVPMKDSGIPWLGQIPEHWRVLPLKRLVYHISRGVTPSYVDHSTVPVINQACIYWDGLKLENVKYHDPNVAVGNKGYVLPGDLLINSTGTGTLGRAVVFVEDERRYIADTHVTVVRVENDKYEVKYLHQLLSTPPYQAYVYSALTSGATNQIELSREGLRNLLLPMPPLEEQQAICDFLEDRVRAIGLIIEQQQLFIGRLQEYRQALITAAVTGKIDVRRDQRERTNIQDVC